MIISKKFILIITFFILCTIGAIAQVGYYYRGKKIPLTVNHAEVCVSVPGKKGEISKEIQKSIKIIDTISDADYDIFVIKQSDLRLLYVSGQWKEMQDSMLVSPCYRTLDGSDIYPTPYLNVRLKSKQDISLLKEYADRYELNIVKNDSFLPLWYVLSVSSETGKNALEIANVIWESGLFAASIPDLCSNDLLCSNDPMFNQQWGLSNANYAGIDVSICPAWNYATGKNIKIAILDQGVDLEHIDLASNISSLSYDTETDSSPSTIYGDHGSHCAGIAAAVKDNGIQIAGVAPDATIVSISNSLAGSTNSRLKRADGIVWAYQNGVDVISNSWRSTTYHAAIDEAIDNAFKYGRNGKGCVITFAAGNLGNNAINYPADCNDTILAVGSIDYTGAKASSSNYGEGLDVVAPGVYILSTLPNDQTGYNSGTSMACPHVAGVAALVLERNSELTVNQVNSIINSNAKKLSGVNFNVTKPDGMWNTQYGYGLVDAYSSVLSTPSVIYIQNDTVTGDRLFSADSIYVGRDVTDAKAYGDVILGQGNITMRANAVTIKNSTSVLLGTTLTIENE